MRINLYLTPLQRAAAPAHDIIASSPSSSLEDINGKASSSSSSSSSSSKSAPKPLLALCPDGELILIELQGSLEMEGLDLLSGGQVAGEFSWGEGKEDKPTLLLSHHRLEGNLTTLPRPLAVLEKRKRRISPKEVGKDEDEEMGIQREEVVVEGKKGRERQSTSSPLRISSSDVALEGNSTGGNPLLENSDDDMEHDLGDMSARERHRDRRSVSPTVQRRKWNYGGSGSGSKTKGNTDINQEASTSSSSLLGPLQKKPKVGESTSCQPSASTTTPSRLSRGPLPPTSIGAGPRNTDAPPSSSPVPLPPMRGSALDFSSPQPAAASLTSSPQGKRIPQRDQNGTLGKGPLASVDAEITGEEEEEEEEEEFTIPRVDEQETPTTKRHRHEHGYGQSSEATPTLRKMAGLRARQTATSYDVVCIVRKKVLFSKRPEPVVYGLGGSGSGAGRK